MSGTAVEMMKCPDCGAERPVRVDRCWLCGREEAMEAEVVDERLREAYASPFAAAAGPGTPWFSTASLVLGLVVLLVGVGLAMEEPGLAVIYAIVVAPALLATYVTEMRFRAKGKPLGTAGKILTFFISVGAVVGTIVVLAVAVLVAFFLYCLVALGS